MYKNMVDWSAFKYKHSGNENRMFEMLSYILFCYEFGQEYGINRYHNQAGIETDLIAYNGENIGFQAKYYEDSVKISERKDDFKKSIEIATQKYPEITKIIFYTNKEFSQSREKNKNKPKWLIEVEKYAEQKHIKIEWKTKSCFEKMLLDKNLKRELNIFFNPDYKDVIIDYSKIEKENYLFQDELYIKRSIINIKDSVKYNTREIENILNSKKRIIILSDAGNGKTYEAQYLTTKLNENSDNFAFYKRLHTYSNQKISEFIPPNYNGLDFERIIFVLDGYDEIATEYKRNFVINLEEFCSNYKNARIVLTSRGNFYRHQTDSQLGTIEKFEEYVLKEIEKEDIDELLKQKQIDNEKFWKEIGKKELKYLIYNPFFLIKIIEIYINEKKLPQKSTIFDTIINRSYEIDKNKFKNSIDIEEFEKNSNNLLGILALTMEVLERNYISDNEYKQIITQTESREIIEHAAIWAKQNNGNWCFVHNNFGEYLAAKQMKKYKLDDIKSLITYNSKIKPSWVNTLIFLISFGRDDVLNYVLECMPEFIVYIENNRFDIEFRREIFRKIFERYEEKRIWMDYNVYENLNLISEGKNIEYLIEKIEKNEHFTIVGNALNILRTATFLYGYEKEIKDILTKVCLGENYANYNKKIAIYILADFKLGSVKLIEEIINVNKKNENSDLRRAYYYFFNKLDIVSKEIELILERYKYTIRNLALYDSEEDDEAYSFDEADELFKCFSKLNTKKSVNRIIDFLLVEKYEVSKEIISSLCDSIFNLYDKKESIKMMLKLYKLYTNSYDDKIIETIIERVKKENILLDFFKEYIKVNSRRKWMEYEFVVNDECMTFFCQEYEKGKYPDEIAEYILRFCNRTLNDYEKLRNIYENTTGKKIIEYNSREGMDYKEIEKKSKQLFINNIFEKNTFKDFVEEFFNTLGKKYITIEELKKLYNIYNGDEKFCYLYNFINSHFIKQEYVSIESFNDWDWNWFIITQIYKIYTNKDNEIELSKKQIDKLYQICNNYMSKVDFLNAIKYSGGSESYTVNWLCIFIWFFRHKFNFKYSQKILLDMLAFDWYINGKKVGINYITKEVDKNKVKKRIIENLNNKNIRLIVFENHIDYCIENDVSDCMESVIAYLNNKKISFSERDDAYKYIVHFYGITEFVERFFYKLDEKYKEHLAENILETNKDILESWLIDKLNKCKKISKKMFWAKQLILSQKEYGIKYYAEWVNINNKAYRDKTTYQDINEALSSIKNEMLIEPLIDLLKITYKNDFKDAKFGGIYSNVRKALVNISSQSKGNYEKIIHGLKSLIKLNQNEQYKNIGFVNYIIDEIEQKNYSNNIKFNLEKTIAKVYELEKECKKESIDWMNL